MRKKQSSTRRMAGSDGDDPDVESAGAAADDDSQQAEPTNSGENGSEEPSEQPEQQQQQQPPPAQTEEANSSAISTRTRGSSGGAGMHTSPVSAPGIYDTVKCTACGKRVNPYNGTMQLHPMLCVLVCQRCYRFYRTGQFDIDHDGKENQCRWCGEGGSLVCCDRCQHSFCKSCIRRNLGRTALQSVEELPDEAVWSCYMCDSAPLKDLQAEAQVVMQAVRDKNINDAARSRKSKPGQAQQQQQRLHQQKLQQQRLQQQAQQLQRASAAGPSSGGFMGGLKLDLSSVPKLPATSAAAAAAAAASAVAMAGGASRQQQQRQLLLQQQQRQRQLLLQQQRIASAATAMPGFANVPAAAQLAMRMQQQQQLQQRQRAVAMAAAGNSAVMTEQWYKKNVRIEAILADIESVNAYNIGPALSATVTLLQGMMRQYSRLMQDLTAARTNLDRNQVVSRFKSAYRMHLFLRLGKLRSIIAEQDRHSTARKTVGSVGNLVTNPVISAASAAAVASAKSLSAQLPIQAAAAAAAANSTGGKTVMDAQGQAIPIAELLPELNRNIREMIERQNQARREAEAAAAAAASGVTIVHGSDVDVIDDVGGAGDVVVLSDEEASSSAAGADGIAELLARRRQREAENSAMSAASKPASSRKKSQPRKITLPATNRRFALDGEDDNGVGSDADFECGSGAEEQAMAAAAAFSENGDDNNGNGDQAAMTDEAAEVDNVQDAGPDDANNDITDSVEDDDAGEPTDEAAAGNDINDADDMPFDSADAASAGVAAAVAAAVGGQFEPLWSTPGEDEAAGGGGGVSQGKRSHRDDDGQDEDDAEEPSQKRSRPGSPGSLETPPSSVTA